MSGKMGPLLALAGLVLISNLGKDELAKQGVKNTCASKLQEKIHCKAKWLYFGGKHLVRYPSLQIVAWIMHANLFVALAVGHSGLHT